VPESQKYYYRARWWPSLSDKISLNVFGDRPLSYKQFVRRSFKLIIDNLSVVDATLEQHSYCIGVSLLL